MILRPLKPGGFVEQVELSGQAMSDDGSLTQDSALVRWWDLFKAISEKTGKTFAASEVARESITDAGFTNVHKDKFKVPIGPWPKDKTFKEGGVWNGFFLMDGLEGFALRGVTTTLKWSFEGVQVYPAGLRKELKNLAIHSYLYLSLRFRLWAKAFHCPSGDARILAVVYIERLAIIAEADQDVRQAVVFTPLSILAVILRFWATKRAGRKPHVEDWLALFSLAIYLAFGGVNLADAKVANGRNALVLINTPEDFAIVRKLIYAALWTYLWQQLFAKFTWIIVASFMLGFHCQPLDEFWNPRLSGHCIQEGTLIAVVEGINSLGDFLLVALAVAIVPTLQVSGATKRKLIVLFGLGVLAGVIGFVKIGISFNDDTVYVFTMVALWSNVQAGVGIVCCCAPVYKPILPAPGFWGRLGSGVSFSSLRQKKSPWGSSQGTYVHTPGQDHQRYWLQQGDGSVRELVWSVTQGDNIDLAVGDANGLPMRGIQVRKDVEIA
ncbi:hypothetical protein AAE478_003669 [Parahypoxylon ruwenzoriense]